jgi:heterotetrameric sarcosine oxidase delta subunit
MMFLIECPWCGVRDQAEFHAHGEAHIARPEDPDTLDDQKWGEYLFYRHNIKGWYRERWTHSSCGRWFNLLRNTVNDEIAQSYIPGQEPPEAPTYDAAALYHNTADRK